MDDFISKPLRRWDLQRVLERPLNRLMTMTAALMTGEVEVEVEVDVDVHGHDHVDAHVDVDVKGVDVQDVDVKGVDVKGVDVKGVDVQDGDVKDICVTPAKLNLRRRIKFSRRLLTRGQTQTNHTEDSLKITHIHDSNPT